MNDSHSKITSNNPHHYYPNSIITDDSGRLLIGLSVPSFLLPLLKARVTFFLNHKLDHVSAILKLSGGIPTYLKQN